MLRLVLFTIIAALGVCAVSRGEEPDKPPADKPLVDKPPGDKQSGLDFFERKIRPLLAQRCYACHSQGAKKSQGGLRVDSRAALLTGGDSGPAIVPEKPDESRLIEVVRYDEDLQMPPTGKLPAEEIALLTEWVRRGAPCPDEGTAPVAKRKIDFEAGRKFWSMQPPQGHVPPQVANPSWVRGPIDAFVLSTLEQKKLRPTPAANRRTLIRRATYDLLGLPPTPEEVEQFLGDTRVDAEDRLIERLLASPRYGERWARYWLDLVPRYSDKRSGWETQQSQAWLYRDWIIRALNDDMPYDQFVCRQLAADQMPGSTPADKAALGFIGLSPVYWKELQLDKEMIKGTVAEEWEERIDTIGRTFLGLSVACARCHDHKFDPISTEDYYALAGVLANTRLVDAFTIPDAEARVVREAMDKVQGLRKEIEKVKAIKPPPADVAQQTQSLEKQIGEIVQQTPHYKTPRAPAVDDAALFVLANGPNATKLEYKPGEAIDLHVQIRGNPSNPGPLVPRRFLTVLSRGESRPFQQGSGRLDLAKSLVHEGAPLSARVIVNRVWRAHFGRGLVETTSDFGSQGARPTHPELLDDLTDRFIKQGWSLKWLHREIMQSAAWRQASDYDAANFAVDPENQFLWRMSRRRLDVEAWRDSILAVCGKLDETMGGAPLPLLDAGNNRRTIYALVNRYEMDDMLRLFDFPDAYSHSPNREPTTTPLQQLFVLNSPFFQRQAQNFVDRLAAGEGDLPGQLRRAYQLLYGRSPTDAEAALGTAFLTGGKPGEQPTPELWRQYTQVLLGSNEFYFVD